MAAERDASMDAMNSGPLAEPDGTGIGRDSGESYAAGTKPKTADPGSASGSTDASIHALPKVMCGVVVASSWHLPVACAFEAGHDGDHSWASIPQYAPTEELAERGRIALDKWYAERKAAHA